LLPRKVYGTEGIINTMANRGDFFLTGPFNMYHAKLINIPWKEQSTLIY
jgi:hypothetical protein